MSTATNPDEKRSSKLISDQERQNFPCECSMRSMFVAAGPVIEKAMDRIACFVLEQGQ